MATHRVSSQNRRRALLRAALVFSFLTCQLYAEPGDSAPQLLSTTGGKGGSSWSSIAELKKAADTHNPQACASYGEALLRGDGVTQNTNQALAYLNEAADKGVANAAFRLGKTYDDGELVPKDYSRAFEYYTTAAKAGVNEAQYNLGVMYVSARGVKLDTVEGLAWLMVAAKNGAPADGETEVRAGLTKSKQLKQIAAAELRAQQLLQERSASGPVVDAPGAATSSEPKRVNVAPPVPQKVKFTPPPPSLPGMSLGGEK